MNQGQWTVILRDSELIHALHLSIFLTDEQRLLVSSILSVPYPFGASHFTLTGAKIHHIIQYCPSVTFENTSILFENTTGGFFIPPVVMLNSIVVFDNNMPLWQYVIFIQTIIVQRKV